MMRNHKIVSTVNATSLLGFVAQKDFHSFFHLTFSSFCYPPALTPPPEPLSTSFRSTLA